MTIAGVNYIVTISAISASVLGLGRNEYYLYSIVNFILKTNTPVVGPTTDILQGNMVLNTKGSWRVHKNLVSVVIFSSMYSTQDFYEC